LTDGVVTRQTAKPNEMFVLHPRGLAFNCLIVEGDQEKEKRSNAREQSYQFEAVNAEME